MDLYHITLYTLEGKPLLVGPMLKHMETAFRNLVNRYPGLKVLASRVLPEKVEMALDFSRLDEDLPRVLQSFKAEVKTLAKAGEGFWRWDYEEKALGPGEAENLFKTWNL